MTNAKERKPPAPKLSREQMIDVLRVCGGISHPCCDCPLNGYADCYKERHYQAANMLEELE